MALIFMGNYLPRKDVQGNTVSLWKAIVSTLNSGSNSYPGALMTLCTPSALAAVITSTAAFGMIVSALSGVHAHYIL